MMSDESESIVAPPNMKVADRVASLRDRCTRQLSSSSSAASDTNDRPMAVARKSVTHSTTQSSKDQLSSAAVGVLEESEYSQSPHSAAGGEQMDEEQENITFDPMTGERLINKREQMQIGDEQNLEQMVEDEMDEGIEDEGSGEDTMDSSNHPLLVNGFGQIIQQNQGEIDTNESECDSVDPSSVIFYGQQIKLPLCACRVPSDLKNDENPPIRCEAVSSVDGEVHACSNRLHQHPRGVSLYRPHVRIPFMSLCTAHLNLLRNHYCCPMCGVFCLKGTFNRCICGSPAHFFHNGCTSINGRCPHCLGADFTQFDINAYTEKPKIGNEAPWLGEHARMTIVSGPAEPLLVDPVCFAPATQKTISTALLARKEDRNQLIQVIEAVKVEGYEPKFDTMRSAIENKHLESLCYLLANGADPNERVDDEDNRALHLAVSEQSYLSAYLLLQSGADSNLQNSSTYTPLILACDKDLPGFTQLLLRFGADPTIRCQYRDTSSSTALHIAAVNGHRAVVHFILKSCPHMTNVQDDGGWTPLAWATEHGEAAIANMLLDQGAKPMLQDVEGNICMHWAAYSGCQSIAERLLKINGRRALGAHNNYGDTPLHVACRKQHWDLVRIFLAAGCDVLLPNETNEMPINMMISAPAEIEGIARIKSQGTERFRSERIVNVDLSGFRENLPIQVMNAVDHEDTIPHFKYVISLVETMENLGIDRRINRLQHCLCTDDCSSGHCNCRTNLNDQPSYSSGVYNEDRTLSEYFDRNVTDTIYECNPACNCSTTCRNRVSQKGIGIHMQIFKTKDRGWAVRTLERVRRGQFICEYAGEILTSTVADARDDDSYLFEMESEGLCHCIDAKTYGNVARFVNHGCAPNLVPLKVFWDHQDPRFPHICFYADRDISEGEELTFDYGEKFWIVKCKYFLCKCGSENCKYNEENIMQFFADHHARTLDDKPNESTETVETEPKSTDVSLDDSTSETVQNNENVL